MYKFSYTLNENDYLLFQRFHHKTAPSAMRSRLKTQLMAVIVLLVTIASIYWSGQFGGTVLRTFLHIFGLVYPAIILFAWNIYINLTTRFRLKSIKGDGKIVHSVEVHVHFGEEDLHSFSEIDDARVKYSIYEKICEDKGAVYLYHSATSATIIPHRAFESETQRDEFLTFIHNRVGAAPCRPS